MDYKEQIKGIALECDLDGTILNIKVDNFNIKNRIKAGQPFTFLIYNDFKKALNFIYTIKTKGVAMDWEFGIELNNNVEILHFIGGKFDNKLLIVGSTIFSELLNYFYEIMKINSEHITQFRLNMKKNNYDIPTETEEEKIYNDISKLNNELTNMQRQLSKSNIENELQSKKLKITLKSIGDGVITTNEDGFINFMNPRAVEIIEWEMSGNETFHINKIFNIYNENTCEKIENIFENTLSHNEINNKDNVYLLSKNNIKKNIQYKSSIIKSSMGDIWGIVLIFRDITELKENEKKLKQTMTELERSNQELEQFAYSVSHDLKSPLSVVISYLRLIQINYGDKLDENYLNLSKQVNIRINHMLELIDNLLSYSRISTKTKKNYDEVDINQVLEESLENLENLIKKTKTDIIYDKFSTVYGDKTQLISVFQNLISNGIKYSKADKNPRIEIREENLEDKWMFSVSDNGIGIEDKDKDQIYLIFKRLYQNEYKGHGIGLALCKKIIERHNGEIWVESTPNHGSTFYFTISKNLKVN